MSRQRSINPSSPAWNHERDCYASRDLADEVRVARRETEYRSLPAPRDGMRRRWRIRKCHGCAGFFVRVETVPKLEHAR